MTTIKLETETIRTIAAFEKVTRVHAKDCLIAENSVYFLVNKDKIGMAVGKGGIVIKEMRRILGKPVRVFGYSENPEDMINSVAPAISIKIEDDCMTVTIQPKDRVMVIGKNGETIRAVRELLKRHYNINNLKLRM